MAYKRGELKGLVPVRLGDLVTIDRKYDLAISNSCGFLEHFLVDTVEEGEACIKYLRDNKIGTAKFMILKYF
jgi:structural maintenance of chromosome 4